MRDIIDPVSRRVRDLRRTHALTQQELADKAGVSRHAVLRLEADARRVHPSTVRKVARALGVAPQRLTIGTEPNTEMPRAVSQNSRGAADHQG